VAEDKGQFGSFPDPAKIKRQHSAGTFSIPDPRPDLARRSAFLLIFFGRLWYKTNRNYLNLSRIAIFTARLSLIFARPASRMV
jgi:hypothetical protein